MTSLCTEVIRRYRVYALNFIPKTVLAACHKSCVYIKIHSSDRRAHFEHS